MRKLFSYSYCNYTQAILFESLTEEEIKEVEAFVRNEMLDHILAKNADNLDSNGSVIVPHQELVECFGELYALKPGDFRFQPGDLKFINLIQQTITMAIEQKGRKKAMQHFGYKQHRSKKEEKKSNETEHGGSNNTKCITASTDMANKMKTKLFEQIADKLKAFAVPNQQIEMFDDSFISVKTHENKIVSGRVECIVCHAKKNQQKKTNPITVHCRSKMGNLSWVLSNFITHLRRTHELVEDQKGKKTPQLANECRSKSNVTETNVSMNFSANELMNMVFDSDSTVTDSIEKKLNEEITKQLVKMWNVATLHGEQFEYGLQCKDVDGSPILFDVVKIPGNGDCMLSSVVHQMIGTDINSDEHKKQTENLRSKIVKYINDNYEDFHFDVRGHVYELIEIAKNTGHDPYGIHAIAMKMT